MKCLALMVLAFAFVQPVTSQAQTCSPNAAGATCDGSGPASQGSTSGTDVGAGTIDSPLGRYSYQHGDPSSNPHGNTPEQAANLTGVDLPTHHEPDQRVHPASNRSVSQSALHKTYHYEDSRHPHHLSGISVTGAGSDGQFSSVRTHTWRFDERGRGIHSEHGGHTLSLSYPTAARPGVPGKTPPGQTELITGQGQRTVYRHAIIGGEHRLLSSQGAGCAQCGPANARYQYDAQGRLIQADIPGQGSQRNQYDKQGRLVRRQDGTGAWERYEYPAHSQTEQPTLIARPSVLPGRERQVHIRYNERGQVLQTTETGFEPIQQQAISRSTSYSYTLVERSGRSVLSQIDGPLPNGPSNSPQDSDITRLQWDTQGSFLIRSEPGCGMTTSAAKQVSATTKTVCKSSNTATKLPWGASTTLVVSVVRMRRVGWGGTGPVLHLAAMKAARFYFAYFWISRVTDGREAQA